jgi:hypothetical protein
VDGPGPPGKLLPVGIRLCTKLLIVTGRLAIVLVRVETEELVRQRSEQ